MSSDNQPEGSYYEPVIQVDESQKVRVHVAADASDEAALPPSVKFDLGQQLSSPTGATPTLPVSADASLNRRNRWVGEGQNQRSFTTGKLRYPSSLDFERVVNEYSIQATMDRVMEGQQQVLDQEEEGEIASLLQSIAEQGEDYSTFPNDRTSSTSSRPPPPPPPLLSSKKNKKHPKRSSKTGRATTRWILTMATGLMTGLISIAIVTATDIIQSWRSNQIDSFWARNNHKSKHHYESEFSSTTMVVFIMYACVNLSLALLSAGLCMAFAPEAVGSGIPEVKAYLNGVRVKRFSSLRLFCVKIVATILSVSSGLAIGPEGPLVHIGAILGASCTKISSFLLRVLPKKLSNRLWAFVTMDLSHFSTDWERRDLVSIGAATGFAAAFGAPIGGLLFAMEETSSYFDQSMFLKTVVATSIATFCLAAHHGNGDLGEYSIISLGTFQFENVFTNRVTQLPLYIIIAISGGVLGGWFCRFWELLQLNRQRVPLSRRRGFNLCQVAFVSLLTSSLCYFVPMLHYFCRAVSETDDVVHEKSEFDPWMQHAHQFDCPDGQINEMATIIFGSREAAISAILSDPSQFRPATLWTVGFMFFPLMALTLGVSLPSGIFMPTFLIGSSLGGAAGLVFRDLFDPNMSTSTFALLGAAALLAGIQRSTVSLCVILVEGTGQVNVMIPVIITVVVARYVGDMITHHGLYEIGVEVNRYPYLEHTRKKRYDMISVDQVMSAPVVTLGPQERAQTLVKLLLQQPEHHGFPVVGKDGSFLGLVRRDQIVALLECGIFLEGCDGDTEGVENELEASQSDETPDWNPKPGIGRSSLMHLAFHIDDDRYDHLPDRRTSTITEEDLEEDEFDNNTWLVSVRQSRIHLADLGDIDDTLPIAGHDSLPPIGRTSILQDSGKFSPAGRRFGSTRSAVSQGRFATVATNNKGNVYIRRLEPRCALLYVDLAAVMNKGTYSVTESTPLSKAHELFTQLGLRHLVVLGGMKKSTDGSSQVVGVLTRVNLLKDYIEERTGYKFD